MKFGKILTFSTISLVINLILRSIQLKYTVEVTTGFFLHEFAKIAGIMLLAIVLSTAVSAAFAFTCCNSPEKPPKQNLVLFLSAILLMVVVLAQVFAERFPVSVPEWQGILVKLLGAATAIFFGAFATLYIKKINFPKILFVVPAVYFIIRIICVFTSISSLAFISDNLFLMAFYCSALLFWLQFAKLYNDSFDDRAFRRLLASGILTVQFSFTQSLPHIIMNVFAGNSYLHTSVIENIAVLAVGVFAAIFTVSHFKNSENC